MTRSESGRRRPAWALIGGAAFLQAGHAASIGRYGLFRDELYYLSCASRPAAGYVDQPAFSILFLGAWRALFRRLGGLPRWSAAPLRARASSSHGACAPVRRRPAAGSRRGRGRGRPGLARDDRLLR